MAYIIKSTNFVQQQHTVNAFTSSDSWVILSPIEQSIKQKIEAVGVPLKDWDIQINYGIKTGCNEAFVFNPNFVADLDYICKRFHIHGAGTPDADFAELLRKYVGELETFEKAHEGEGSQGGALFKPHVPQWAVDLYKDRYNIKLIN